MPLDITACYPTQATCEQDLVALYRKTPGKMAASESCSLLEASIWINEDLNEAKVELGKTSHRLLGV